MSSHRESELVKIVVKKSQLSGRISCPPSKSYSHRAIVISSLSNGVSNLKNVFFPEIQLQQSIAVKCLEYLWS